MEQICILKRLGGCFISSLFRSLWSFFHALSLSFLTLPPPHSYGLLEQTVKQIIVKNNVTEGVLLQDGTVVSAKTVLSNATPKVTFLDLLSDVRGSPSFCMYKVSCHFHFQFTRPLSQLILRDNWQPLITTLQ